MRRTKYRDIILWTLLLLPYIALIPTYIFYNKVLRDVKDSSVVIISKQEMILYHYNYKGDLLQKSAIACGSNFGNKTSAGDYKTPEGIFHIGAVIDASAWSHDFKNDSLGEIKGAYGPYFINLNVPGQKGIGIHGTHDSKSIGKRVTEGCIRMQNRQLVELVDHIKSVTIVIIVPSRGDLDSTAIIVPKRHH